MIIPLDPERDIFINYIDTSYTGKGFKLIDSAPPEAVESLRVFEQEFKEQYKGMSIIEN